MEQNTIENIDWTGTWVKNPLSHPEWKIRMQNSSYKRNFVEDIYEVSIICKSSINFLNG